MRRSAEAEIQAESRRTKMIVIDHTERACINGVDGKSGQREIRPGNQEQQQHLQNAPGGL